MPVPTSAPDPEVTLRRWEPGDLSLLLGLLGDPGAMVHLGGAEPAEAIQARHERYLAFDPAKGGLFAIVLDSEAEAVGWAGYWECEWQSETVWECGWHLLPEAQHHGVATFAAGLLVAESRAHGVHRHLHAFPAVDNDASNALCRRAGFERRGEAEVEYPPGRLMRSNDWRVDLHTSEEGT